MAVSPRIPCRHSDRSGQVPLTGVALRTIRTVQCAADSIDKFRAPGDEAKSRCDNSYERSGWREFGSSDRPHPNHIMQYVDGDQPNDRKWQFCLYGSYAFNSQWMFRPNLFVGSGHPIPCLGHCGLNQTDPSGVQRVQQSNGDAVHGRYRQHQHFVAGPPASVRLRTTRTARFAVSYNFWPFMGAAPSTCRRASPPGGFFKGPRYQSVSSMARERRI